MHAALGIEEVALYSKPRCSPYGCKKESRTPHELYLQTLQEARLASQPRPRSAISTRSAATFCSHLATESLASNGKIKVRRKTRPNTAQSIPTNSPAKLKEEVLTMLALACCKLRQFLTKLMTGVYKSFAS